MGIAWGGDARGSLVHAARANSKGTGDVRPIFVASVTLGRRRF
jgi:hypothetical protein